MPTAIDFVPDDQASPAIDFQPDETPVSAPNRFQAQAVQPPPESAGQISRSLTSELGHRIVSGIGKGLRFVGQSLAGGLADVGSDITGQTLRERQDVQSGQAPQPSNIEQVVAGEQPAYQTQRKVLPTPLRVASAASSGLVESVPQLAAVAGAEAIGIPAPIAAAAVFGTTPEGFDPKQAAIAAALPFVGKYSGEITGAIAKKFGVSSTDAINLWKAAGGVSGAAGYAAVIDESEIQNLPPEQRKDARIDAVAGLIGQSALGPMGVEFKEMGPGEIASKALQEQINHTLKQNRFSQQAALEATLPTQSGGVPMDEFHTGQTRPIIENPADSNLPATWRKTDATDIINEQSPNVPRIETRTDLQPNATEVRKAPSAEAGSGDSAVPNAQAGQVVVPPEVVPQANEPPLTPPDDRAVKIARIKEITALAKPLSDKGGLTKEEATRFRALMAEANSLRYDVAKPLTIDRIPSPAERQSTIPSEIVLTARNDLMRNKDIYAPIVDAATGVSHDANTAIDDVMTGVNPKVSPQQFYDAFSATREAIRNHYGDTIRLFRAEGKQRGKPTQNWATTKEYAEQFGNKIVSKEVPIDNVLAVNVGSGGKYHEVIVGEPPDKEPAAPAPPAAPAETTDQTNARKVRARVAAGIEPSHISISVTPAQTHENGQVIPAQIQIDERHPTLGNTFSVGPEVANENGLKLPSRDELAKLPQGQYTLPNAIAKLKELGKAKAEPETVAEGYPLATIKRRLPVGFDPETVRIENGQIIAREKPEYGGRLMKVSLRKAEAESYQPTSESPTTTAFDPSKVATVEAPIRSIKLSKDVPNFKGEASVTTGVVPGQELTGKYERRGTAPVVLWKRTDGRLEIITGRHRLDLARRNREKTIPAQIMDEAQGFTKAMALSFDAEANIRDGQGTIKDYAHYFKLTPDLTESEAVSRGLLSRAKGKTGWQLARLATDDLYSLWLADKLTDEQAAAIVKAAPSDAALQRIGVKQAAKGRTADQLTNDINAAKVLTATIPTEQMDMFGSNDAAIQQMERMSDIARAKQRDIQDDIRSISGASKNPERARKLGVDVKDPAAVDSKLRELQAAKMRWDNWSGDAELIRQIKAEAEPKPEKEYIYHSPNRPVLSISNYLPKGWKLINERTFSVPEKLDLDQIKQWELVPDDQSHPINVKKRFEKFKDDLMAKVSEGDGVGLKVNLKDRPSLLVTENIGSKSEVEEYPFRITNFTQDGRPSGHMTYRDWDEVVRALWGHSDDIVSIENRKAESKHEPVKPAANERALTSKEQNEFQELSLIYRANRESGGPPLTTEQTKRYEFLTSLAGQKSLFDIDASTLANQRNRDEAELRNLEKKLAEMQRQEKLAIANWNKSPTVHSKFRKEAMDWEKAIGETQPKIAELKRKLSGAAPESAAVKSAEPDLFGEPPRDLSPEGVKLSKSDERNQNAGSEFQRGESLVRSNVQGESSQGENQPRGPAGTPGFDNARPSPALDEAVSRLTERVSSGIERGERPEPFIRVEPHLSDPGTRTDMGMGADTRKKIESVFGTKIVFVNTGRKLWFNGATDPYMPGYTFVNVRSQKPYLVITGHELVHAIQYNDHALFLDMKSKLVPLMRGVEEYKTRINAWYAADNQSPLTHDQHLTEIIGDFVGDSLADPKFWDKLAAKEPSLFRKLASSVLKFLSDTIRKLGGYDLITDIDKAHGIVADALTKFAKSRGEEPPPETERPVTFSKSEPTDEESRIRAHQVASQSQGELYESENIAAQQESIRRNFFDAKAPSTPERDDTFWQLAHEMTGKNAGENADVIFHTIKDDLGGSAEMAPALLKTELMNYALRAAVERKDRSMLQYLVANDTRFAVIAPGSNLGSGTSGRSQRAVQEFSKTAYWKEIQRITDDRIESAGKQLGIGAERFHQLMDTVDALNLNPDELERLIREGKDKQGRTLEEIFGKPEGEPDELLKLITMLPLPDLPAELRIKSQKSLADRIMAQFPVSNLRDRFSKEGGDKLARQWWAILSGKAPEPEAKTVFAADQILQRELSGILKETLAKLGFEKVKGVQITDAEKLAMVLGKSELRGNKWERVDGQVRAAIEERRATELASARDDAELANIINEKYDQIKDAWDTASDSILNVPASDQMLRRMMHAELKGLNVDWNDLLQRGASTAELRRRAVDAALAKVQAAATNKLDLKATRSAMEGAFDQIEQKARNRYQMSQARRNEPTSVMANQRIAQGIMDAFEKKQGAEVVLEPRKRNVVRQIIAEFLNPNSEQTHAIAENTFKGELIDRLTATDVGVDPTTARRLAQATWNEALGRFADRNARRVERAAGATNLRGLIEDILRTPYRAQHDPEWRKNMAMQWFMSNGLSREQARAATALFDKQFQTAYQAAGEKAARRFLGDHEEPKTVNEIVAAIRLGLTDPRKNWADDIAARSKFVPLTEAQQNRLSDLELKRGDEALSPGERNAIEEQMMSIFRHTGTMDGQKMRRLGESFVASLLSGPRTATIQLEPLIMTMRDFPIIAARDPANAMQFFKAMKDSWKHIFASEFKYAWQKDAYGYHLQDIDRDHNALKTWWEKLDAEYKAAKNPGQKAWVRTRQIIASQQYVSRFLSSIDQAMMATAREWKLVYYASEAFKLAGIKDKRAISDLTDAVIMARQSAYNDAVNAGVPSDAAKVRANWMVEQVVKDFVNNRTDDGIASQVLKATENDMYSMVGRRGRAGLGKGTIAEMEEGFLSRPMNHFMEFMSKMRGHGGPDSIVSTAIFGFVNIPFRTARYWAQFSPYGLLRYGIHRYRLGQGKDTYWKQMFGTELQARARLREAVAGTAALGLASAWAAYNSTADDKAGTENFGLYITGQGPTNKVLRDAWQKQHWQQYALNFVIGGRKVSIPLTRVGEAILYPFIIAAAQDDAKWKVKELAATGKPAPNPISNLVSTLVGEYFSMTGQRGVLQGVTALSETARGGGMLKMAANQAATVASGLLIPWKQLLAGISDMFVGPLDQSSISSLIASKFPIVGLPAQTRAVNRFGDPLYDRSWYGRIARTGVPIAFEVSKTPENEGLYPMLVDKGAAAPELRRYLLEEKYGPLTDAQFSKFAAISGAALKSQTNASLSDLQAMAPDEVKKFLTKAAHAADQEAVAELGLENVKPSKNEQMAASVGVASTPRGTSGADIGRIAPSSGSSSAAAAAPAPRASASLGVPRAPSVGYRGRLTAPGSRSSGGRLSLRAPSSSASRSHRLVSGRLRVRSGGTRRRLSYRSPGRRRSRFKIHA